MACASINEYDSGSDEISDTVTVELIKSRAEKGDINDECSSLRASLEESFQRHGVKGISDSIRDKMHSWKNETLNIAVTGRSGVGKSTFINAIRNDMNELQPGYAPVGHKECTKTRKPYTHPNNELLTFWDLPGVGTDTFPRQTYLKHTEINFQMYDMFIIMACDRFTQDESWLAEEIKKTGRPYLFVRSKVDAQIDSDAIQKRKASKEPYPSAVIKEIREDCEQHLPKEKDIYLINSNDIHYTNLDFPDLILRLVDGFSGLKSEAILYSIDFLTPDILQRKINSLRKRIWGMGALSSITGAVPFPGTSLVADALLIVNETRLYRKQLGLSDNDMEALSDMMNLPIDRLAAEYSLESLALSFTIKGLMASSVLICSEVIESAVGLAVPVIGMPVGAVLSFITTVKLLRSILAILEKDARIVLNLVLSKTKSSIMKTGVAIN
ncbi:T-cell-specific guanine nucleotide triphosphate-binding protein 2-like [Ruditapes philippinarum]|uniref:T-cell-specific guanine nucleotide triphosphate-binding protein 2-like n=1 Tax=Ruditapes philippinarum TaxID=129788 RepID=UPI00295B58BE|nr:T-cell-specific guanine nucleotide triphosphate-binding protein 2-like [Ruditapes philippinarum]